MGHSIRLFYFISKLEKYLFCLRQFIYYQMNDNYFHKTNIGEIVEEVKSKNVTALNCFKYDTSFSIF